MESQSVIIVTAAQARQAEAYAGALRHCPWPVRALADPDGVRIGSGGATARALRHARSPATTLVLHSGGDSQRNPLYSVAGKAFCALPEGDTPIDRLLELLTALARHAPARSCIVCATDVILTLPVERVDAVLAEFARAMADPRAVVGLAIAGEAKTAQNHGVYEADVDGRVRRFLQKPSPEQLATVREPLIDTGVLFVGAAAVDALLAADVAEHERYELYSDVLLVLDPSRDEKDYLSGGGGDRRVRGALWAAMEPFRGAFRCVSVPDGRFTHLGTTREFRDTFPVDARVVHSIVDARDGGERAADSLVEHSHLTGRFRVGRGAVVSGVRAPLVGVSCAAELVVQFQRLPASGDDFVIKTYGIHDAIKKAETFCHRPIPAAATDLLWAHVTAPDGRSLWNARLFPLNDLRAYEWLQDGSYWERREWREAERLSFQDILARSEPVAEFAWRRSLRADVSVDEVGADDALLRFMEGVVGGPHAPPHVAARAQCLAALVHARNGRDDAARAAHEWSAGLIRACLLAGFDVRYEEAAPVDVPARGTWVHVRSAVRIDLAGGWSDTPPICFDRQGGGRVVNVAVCIDGERPLSVSARRLRHDEEDAVIIRTGDAEPVTLKSAAWASPDPREPGALVRCVLVEMGLESGYEVRTASHLPTGTGLGVSSILAAAVIKALACVVGRTYTAQRLAHITLAVEQRLTTGGGWQDQVGALLGGFKTTVSAANRLPLVVQPRVLAVSDAAWRRLEAHTVVVYTGKSRLAKNLLQTVVSRWFSRDVRCVELVDALKRNAVDMEEALVRGDVARVGHCLAVYWSQKKEFADGAEPPHVSQLMGALEPLSYGQSLCGAGGGGFLCCITREPHAHAAVQEAVQSFADVSVHQVTFASDEEGMVMSRSSDHE